jgi:hypothetical protein
MRYFKFPHSDDRSLCINYELQDSYSMSNRFSGAFKCPAKDRTSMAANIRKDQ